VVLLETEYYALVKSRTALAHGTVATKGYLSKIADAQLLNMMKAPTLEVVGRLEPECPEANAGPKTKSGGMAALNLLLRAGHTRGVQAKTLSSRSRGTYPALRRMKSTIAVPTNRSSRLRASRGICPGCFRRVRIKDG
jgi:hypothetical protein